jgi:hypothetical protein
LGAVSGTTAVPYCREWCDAERAVPGRRRRSQRPNIEVNWQDADTIRVSNPRALRAL